MTSTRPLLTLAVLALSTVACEESNTSMSPPDLATPQTPLFVVAGSDFMSGGLTAVELPSLSVRKNLDTVGPQSVVRGFGNMLYAIDQSGGLVRQYDASQGFKNPVEFPADVTDFVSTGMLDTSSPLETDRLINGVVNAVAVAPTPDGPGSFS